MTRVKAFGLGGVAAGLLVIGALSVAQDRKPDAPASQAGDKHAAMFKDCAKACDDCGRICDECAAHCAKSLADGNKHHLETLKTCQDCAAICQAASAVVAKQGPFSDIVCTACADACKRCGEACEKHGGGDPVMKACADECKKCEKVCREMLKHTGPGK
ncbi:MAG TPA: four-helix bundle copper-binding protein [Gemmataceae bacterium]|nr:four-helix bundle copper-binding protein [Gemmataceae bacterium]